MNKRNLIFGIAITVISLLAILTMFMPYLKIETKEVVQAFNSTFENIADIDAVFEDEETDSVTLIRARSGIKLLDDVMGIKKDQTYNYILSLKRLVAGLLLLSWISALATIVFIWLLKNRARYIAGMTTAFISCASSVALYIGVPGIAKHALIEAIEKSLFNDYGIYEHLLGSFVKDTVLDYLGEFCRKLLQRSVQIGFWILMIAMAVGFVVSMIGLILEIREGRAEAPAPNAARIYGINGEYAGAEVLVGDGILLGRDPSVCQLVFNKEKISRRHCNITYNAENDKFVVTDYSSNGTYIQGGSQMKKNVPTELPAGTTIQLGKNGDTFRLGNDV